MKIVLLSDLHLINENPVARLDDLTEVQWEKLSYVFNYAKDHGINYILQAGDLVDIKRSWELLQKLSKFLIGFPDIKLLIVQGQHDSYYRDMGNKKTVVGVLESAMLLQILTAKPIKMTAGMKVINIYGASYGEIVPEPISRKGINILVVHKQIGVEKVFEGQKDFIQAETFLRNYSDYDLILCGDCHQNFELGVGDRVICNTGPMLRHEASEQMFHHRVGFFIYDPDDKSLVFRDIPNTDAELVLSRKHLIRERERKNNFQDFIERVRQTEEKGSSVPFEDNLYQIMDDNKTTKVVRELVAKYLSEVDNV